MAAYSDKIDAGYVHSSEDVSTIDFAYPLCLMCIEFQFAVEWLESFFDNAKRR